MKADLHKTIFATIVCKIRDDTCAVGSRIVIEFVNEFVNEIVKPSTKSRNQLDDNYNRFSHLVKILLVAHNIKISLNI